MSLGIIVRDLIDQYELVREGVNNEVVYKLEVTFVSTPTPVHRLKISSDEKLYQNFHKNKFV